MKLILDFGNTLKKIAVFDGDDMIDIIFAEKIDQAILKKIIAKHPSINSSIVSSVIEYPASIDEFLSQKFRFIKLNSKTKLPITINYSTPQTLGNDRIAAVVAASHEFEKQNLLVIDIGSCITYDIISNEKIYLGGGISPGLNLRLRALNQFTDRLPLLEPQNVNYLIGKSTEESILSGVMNGTIAEIDTIISSYKEYYEKLTIIMSGGDYKYFDKKLKNNIFALPNIVLKGLNVILDFNE